MREYCEVRFRKKSKLAKINNNLYNKKDIFSFLVEAQKKGLTQTSKVIRNKKRRRYNFVYVLKEDRDILKLRVIVDEEDLYSHLFLELREKKKFNWKKAIAYTLVPVMLYSYSIEAGEDKTHINFDIEDEMFDDFIDKNFFTFDENINLSFDQTIGYDFEDELSSEAEELISYFNFEGTLKSAFEGIYSSAEINHDESILDYYDRENDILDKETLAKIILQNSSDPYKTIYYPYGKVVYDEIYMILIEVEKYISYRLNDLDFDLEHFLCNLEQLLIYKNTNYTPDQENIIAFMPVSYTREKVLVFNVFTEDKLNESYVWCSDTETIFHEMEHLYEMDCNCCSNKIYKCGSAFIFSEEAKLYDQFYSEIYYNRFLTEWSAENVEYFYSSNFDCYLYENLIMHNLEFALNINPDYKFGTLAKAIKNRETLEMWRVFPYLYDEKQELIEYLSMLKAYDIVLYENNENRDDYVRYACNKHIEIFYKNLLYANEKSETDMLFYDFAMIKVFEDRMSREGSKLFYNKKEFDDYFLECRNQFKEYLSSKYDAKEIEKIENRVLSLTGYGLLEYIDYPDSVDKDKENFYFNMLQDMEVYSGNDESYIYVYK